MSKSKTARLGEKYKAPLEKEITQAIRGFLNFIDFWHWKVWQGLGSKKGVSDIVGIAVFTIEELIELGWKKVGVFTAIEVKREKGRLTEHQEKFKDNVERNHGIFITGRGIEDVEVLKTKKFFKGV